MSINKVNKNLPFIYKEDIIEWDIQSANTSLMRLYKLAPEKIIDKIDSMSSLDRKIYVGNMQRENKEFSKALENAFTDIVKAFIRDNNLDFDTDIVSIKKDAIFVKNKTIKSYEYGPVLFRPKSSYENILMIPKFEFYINGNSVDVKGLNDNNLDFHRDGVLSLVSGIFENRSRIIKYMQDYANAYKNRLLDFNAYREFNDTSKFSIFMGGQKVYLDHLDETMLMKCDISHNYINIYLEILKVLMAYIK